jgi:hypothetical protein
VDQRTRAGSGASQRIDVRIERRHPNAIAADARAQARCLERWPSLGWLLLSALGLMAALSFLSSTGARAENKVELDQGGAVADTVDPRDGMPSSNPRVRSILAAHPGQYVVICVAGCNGKPHAVQILPRPVTARAGGYLPSMAKMGKEAYGPPRPAALARSSVVQANDVVCVAGCVGRPGQVVQRVSGLPPPARRKASNKKRDNRLDLLP